jgi:hypothetical protein
VAESQGKQPRKKRGRPLGPSPVESVDSALKFLKGKRPDEAERQVLLDSAGAVLNNRNRLAVIRSYLKLIRDEEVARLTRVLSGHMTSLAAGTMALVNPSLAQTAQQVRALEDQARRFMLLGFELTWAANTLDGHRASDADIDLAGC